MSRGDRCVICGNGIDEQEWLVLVRGKAYLAHCSEFCLGENLRQQRHAAARARRRWLIGLLAAALPLATAALLWKRYRAPQPEAIASWAPDPLPAPPDADAKPAGPVPYGPPWPPTDEDWLTVFERASWTHPLPGPVRRAATVDSRLYGQEAPAEHPPRCRVEGHCAVDLGGELWGEHVYAVHDGVVERVQGAGNEERGGQYVRLSHFGGMVFTQYFHLAAIPKGISRGARIRAGEVIGLLGDSGLKAGGRRHLHFAFSVRPSSRYSEVYWDPRPWMARWSLRVPPQGTVAGLMPPPRTSKPGKTGDSPRRRRWR